MQGTVEVLMILILILGVVLIYTLYCLVDILILVRQVSKGNTVKKNIFNLFRIVFGINKSIGNSDEYKINKDKVVTKISRTIIIAIIAILAEFFMIIMLANMAVSFNNLQRMTLTAAVESGGKGSEITDPNSSWTNGNITGDLGPGEDTGDGIPDDGDSSDDNDGDSDNSDGSGGSSKPSLPGHAKGTFARALDDGTYYWYHQSQYCLTCKWCGDFSDMEWGDPPAGSGILAKEGCAVYSLAIIASNLLGKQITPRDLLKDFGANVYKNDSGKWEADTKDCTGWIGQNAVFADIRSQMKKEYGLTNKVIDLSKKDREKQIKKILDQGGYVWIFIHNQHDNYPFINAKHHFIVIRKYDENGYYFFDECAANVDRMNTPVKASKFLGNVTSAIGFINPNDKPADDNNDNSNNNDNNNDNSNDDSSSGTNSTSGWYSSASKISKYTDYIDLGNGFKLYNGLPWSATSNTYVADTDQMLVDVVDYINSVSTEKLEVDVDGIAGRSHWGYTRHLNDKSVDCNVQGGNHFKDIADGQYTDIDGIRCAAIGVPPAVLDKNYNKNWNYKGRWTYNPAADYSKYQYGTKKMAAIMQEKSTGKVYYLPCSNCDAKAHTFPGGVAQTSIALVTKNEASSKSTKDKVVFSEIRLAKNSSGYSYETMKDVDQTQLGKILNSVGANGNKYYINMWNVAEFWNIPSSTYSKLSGKYRVIGFVVWD